MATVGDIPATTRAYTLKLSGDNNWRELLWQTHVAVNRGAWVWGDWLLTLRGGLPASLADGHAERRVLLALSWLSVESPASLAPKDHIVASGSEATKERNCKVKQGFRTILRRLGFNPQQEQEWLDACLPALEAAIREDAVWVDRSACFAEAQKRYEGLCSQWACQTLFDFLGGEDEYFALPDAEAATSASEAKNFAIKAGHWLSGHWGAGKKTNLAAISTALNRLAGIEPSAVVGSSGRDALAVLLTTLKGPPKPNGDAATLYGQLKQAIGWKGAPSKGARALEKVRDAAVVTEALWQQTVKTLREEAEDKSSSSGRLLDASHWLPAWRQHMESTIGMPYRGGRDYTWEHAVMLDHALRRVSSAHTWIKRAEMQRCRFQQEAAMIKSIPDEARGWLDDYRQTRSSASGTLGEYLIRSRAIDGWDKVVQAWDALGPNSTREQRIDAARDVQANLDEDEKFGDIQLFAGFGGEDVGHPERCLADDDAICIWRNANGRADPDILKVYVAATVAEHDQQRFKVPAYRHPDPLKHPVYVDYGKSRWSIEYSALKAAHERRKTSENLDQASSYTPHGNLQQKLTDKPNLCRVTLGVWSGKKIDKIALRWHGKRFWRDLDLEHAGSDPSPTVSRADRLGRVVAKQPSAAAVRVAEVFEQNDWNGRLQVPRRELERLADLVYGKRAAPDFDKLISVNARQLQKLSWFLTISITVKPQGPWLDYLKGGLPQGIQYKKGRDGYHLHYDANQGRKGRARLCLARLPGLRVLSLDLGHRYAAACAVWETLTSEQMIEECRKAGRPQPSPDDLFIHLHHQTDKTQKSGRNKGKPVRKTTIYRRIGPDQLPDGTKHPAPWARLERQFLIKLQGEDRPARRASPEEISDMNKFREFLGLSALVGQPRVDDLYRDAVRLARLGLRRLADAAAIAFAMTATKKPISGGREVTLTPEKRIDWLQDELLRWQQLAASRRYRDDWARESWQSYIVEQLGGPQPAELGDDLPRSQRANTLDAARQSLREVAEKLSDHQSRIAVDLHSLWAKRWQQRQAEWRKYLRWLRRLILPRKNHYNQAKHSIYRVGGLSLKRIQTIRQLYQVLKAFSMRPEPSNLAKNIPGPGERSWSKFGRRILNCLERLREQRIKQLASRVVEAALGAGRIKKPLGRDRKRPPQSVDTPCHAVVIENLQHYKPEDSRLRRENRQLMDWQARNLRKYIAEGCELHGLLFIEVSPAYTSRQDSRTGAPGIRCEEVPRAVLEQAALRIRALDSPALNPSPGMIGTRSELEVRGWVQEFRRVAGSSSGLSPRQSLLKAFLNAQAELPSLRNTVWLPRRGGELFVSADPASPIANGLQADLNAAANIGLKALTDPDWMGAWWFVLVNRTSGEPLAQQVQGCPIWESCTSLSSPLSVAASEPDTKAGRSKAHGVRGRARASEYLWSNLSASNRPEGKEWESTQAYWQKIEQQVADRLLGRQLTAENPF